MPESKKSAFSMHVTIGSEVDFDATVDRIVDAAAELGWTCHGVGEPGQLFFHIVEDTQKVTMDGKNDFCAWVETLEGVTSYEATAHSKGA
jgi:hypothetical protein